MMKKRILAAAAAAVLTISLAGCASNNAAYLSGIKASVYAEPCDYSAIPVEEAAPSVSDAYVDRRRDGFHLVLPRPKLIR